MFDYSPIWLTKLVSVNQMGEYDVNHDGISLH